MSPVAWQHLSFLGKYEFCNKDNIINIQKVIENLLTNPKSIFRLKAPSHNGFKVIREQIGVLVIEPQHGKRVLKS